MNISHTSDNEQAHDDDFEYSRPLLKLASASHSDKNSLKSKKQSMTKVLELLDDVTPNYLLGYN